MESVVITNTFWKGKKVLITGHTGFKGSWLALWLQELGAEVTGLSLAPPTQPSLFEKAQVAKGMRSISGDIRDLAVVTDVLREVQPEIVFHLAAQALVRYSYQHPVETYQTNVMGTLHVLEAIRSCSSVRAAVMVTTDKCYDNKEWHAAYRETDPMGGHDPYSSSKGCAELLIASYRQSYFSNSDQPAIASARAGNVIGGGDWSQDRLIPDLIRAFQAQQIVKIRNPDSIRPWQYVLEPLAGYLTLAESLYQDGRSFSEAWNFGPAKTNFKTVKWIVQHLAKSWPGAQWEIDSVQTLQEAQILKLDSTKAQERLGWHACYALQDVLKKIVKWYQSAQASEDLHRLCLKEIESYTLNQFHVDDDAKLVMPRFANKGR